LKLQRHEASRDLSATAELGLLFKGAGDEMASKAVDIWLPLPPCLAETHLSEEARSRSWSI